MKIQTRNKKIPVLAVVAVALLLVALGYIALAYQNGSIWPLTTETPRSESPDLPKVQGEDRISNPEDNIDTPDTTPGTKTENKTPAQYEGDQATDTPEYNNEQFRIPENSQ